MLVLHRTGFASKCHNFCQEYPILKKVDSLKRYYMFQTLAITIVLTKMLSINVLNMSQWQLSQTSKWYMYHGQPYGILNCQVEFT